jgi:hypothetical protein
MTLQATSDLLVVAGLKPLNWPPVRFRNPIVNTWIYALCGAIEVSEALRGHRPWPLVRLKHVAWLLAAGSTPFLLAAAALGLWPAAASGASGAGNGVGRDPREGSGGGRSSICVGRHCEAARSLMMK